MHLKQQSKADLTKKQKVVEEKTFGLKMKNKSKSVQSLEQSVQLKPDATKINAQKKKEEEQAREKELNELLKVAIRQAKVPVEDGKETMEDWDQETLEKVVESKSNEYNKNKPSDIVCKHFLEAVEKKQYGWFWVCPNGGKECHYGHALPPGYVLKSQMKALLEEEAEKIMIEEIENQRAKVSTTTPMTPELFMQWKQEKMEERQAGLATQRAERAKNDRMSVRELFLSDSSLFVDDAEAYDKYRREEKPDSEQKGDGVQPTEPLKTAVYNKDGLFDKLADISWPENVDWIQKLSIDIDQVQEVDVNDDLNRELAFYTQALEGARQVFEKFQSMGLPFLRPSDYYAEMVKTDRHMEKVKGRLLTEKRKTEEAEERRKARENKKLAKEIQAQKQRERAKQKKEDIESVKKWRKQRQQCGFAKDDNNGDLSLAFEDGKSFERSNKRRPGVFPGDRSGGKAKLGGGKGKTGFNKRKGKEFKDAKFGFGGKKGMKKQNTAETTNDFGGFNKNTFPRSKKQKR